ncbi:MAG: hypothetical protein AABW53_00195 [Nanoarchaeota archaeon]
MATETSSKITVEPIVLDNGLLLDGEAVRNPNGSYRIDSQQGWERYLAPFGKRLPTVGEYIAAIKQLHEGNDSYLAGILQNLQESALCIGTKINYDKSNLPLGNGYLDDLVKDPACKRALEEEIFQYDALETIDIIQCASGKRPYIWTPSAKSRKKRPERAVWLYGGTDWFYLLCYNRPISLIGRARGVRVEGAAGAQNTSASKESAKTPEGVLEEKIAEELAVFDGFMGTKNQPEYFGLKQQAILNLIKLHHGK